MANVKTDSRTDKPRTPRNQKKVVDQVLENFTRDKNNRTPLEADWKKAHEDYNCDRDSRVYPWKSNLFIPMFFSDVETRVPAYVTALLSEIPILSCLPYPDAGFLDQEPEPVPDVVDQEGNPVVRPRSDLAIQQAKLCEALLARQLHPTAISKELTMFIKSMCMYHKAVFKIVWDARRQSPRLVNADIWDYFPDMAAGDIESGSHVNYRVYRYYKKIARDAKRSPKNWFNVAKLGKLRGVKSDNTSVAERLAVRGLSEPLAGAIKGNPKLELIESWDDDFFAVVEKSSRILIRWHPREEHPYKGKVKEDVPEYLLKPFVDFSPYPLVAEQYGMSDHTAVKSLQQELNDLRNQRLDGVHLTSNPMFIAGPLAQVPQSQLVSKPGKVVHVGQFDQFGPMPMPEIRPEIYREEETIKQDGQYATGAFDYMRGATPERAEAVGVFRGLQSAGARRFQSVVLRLNAEVIKPIGRAFIEMDRRLLRPDYVLRMTGDNKAVQVFETLRDPQRELPAEVDIMPVMPGEVGSKQVRVQQLINYLATMSGVIPPEALLVLAEAVGKELVPGEIEQIMAAVRRITQEAQLAGAAEQATGSRVARGNAQNQPGAGASEATLAQSEGAMGQGGGTQG